MVIVAIFGVYTIRLVIIDNVMKKYIIIIAVSVLVIVIGKYLWPFLSYLFGVDIRLPHTIICPILVLIGVISFFIKRTSKITGIGLMIIAMASWFSFSINKNTYCNS